MESAPSAADTLTADAVISVLRAHTTELRAAGVRHLSLFGSMARGDATPESDIDLAAEFYPGMDLFKLAALERRLSALLGRRAEITPEPAEKLRLQQNIDRDRRRAF